MHKTQSLRKSHLEPSQEPSHKFIFKVKMTFISIQKNAKGISLIAISNISSPIFWSVRNKNDELFRKVQAIYQK